MSSLIEACQEGDTERVELLLEKAASVNEKEEDGMCFTVLMRASWEGHTKVVQLLLDKGALVDEKAKDGDTALMLASQKDHTEVMKLLLDKGALVDVKNEYGNTALSQASRRGHTKAVKLLLEKSALIDEIRSPELRALESVECRNYDWQECASAIIEKLKAEGVQRGQVLSIDAHSNGPSNEAIFSAHYSKALPGLGPLDNLTFDD